MVQERTDISESSGVERMGDVSEGSEKERVVDSCIADH